MPVNNVQLVSNFSSQCAGMNTVGKIHIIPKLPTIHFLVNRLAGQHSHLGRRVSSRGKQKHLLIIKCFHAVGRASERAVSHFVLILCVDFVYFQKSVLVLDGFYCQIFIRLLIF